MKQTRRGPLIMIADVVNENRTSDGFDTAGVQQLTSARIAVEYMLRRPASITCSAGKIFYVDNTLTFGTYRTINNIIMY